MIDGLATHSNINSNTKEVGSCIKDLQRSYKPKGKLLFDRFESTIRQAIIINNILLEHDDPIIPLSPSSLIEEQILIGNVLQHNDPVGALSPFTSLDNEEILVDNVMDEISCSTDFASMTEGDFLELKGNINIIVNAVQMAYNKY